MTGNSFVVVENGCTHHVDCFTCPLPDCMYSSPSAMRRIARNKLIKMDIEAGKTIQEIADKLGLVPITVRRIIASGKRR